MGHGAALPKSASITLRKLAFVLVIMAPFAHTQRLVLAHYMLANGDYQSDDDGTSGETRIAAYEHEIREAQSIGIDGFALNAGGWFNEPHYIRRSSEMFEAAYRLHSGFRLVFSADFCCGLTMDDVEDMMRRFANNDRYSDVYLHKNGRAVLTTFSGQRSGTAIWKRLRSDLENGLNPSTRSMPNALTYTSAAPSNAPMPIFLVTAFFWGGELPHIPDVTSGLSTWHEIIDGGFYWGIAGVPGLGKSSDQLTSSHAYARVLHDENKLYIAPVCFQFWGANADRYYEYGGYAGMRRMWMDAIKTTHPDWIEIITWNDFIEGSYISPIDDPHRYPNANALRSSGIPAEELDYFHNHRGAWELTSYFIRWYKTGKQPKIMREGIHWAYRTQPADAQASTPSTRHIYGPIADDIYITANLERAATLRVTTGSHVETIRLAAGSTDRAVPFHTGPAPHFELQRQNKMVAAGDGSDPIEASPRFRNFYYSTGSVFIQSSH